MKAALLLAKRLAIASHGHSKTEVNAFSCGKHKISHNSYDNNNLFSDELDMMLWYSGCLLRASLANARMLTTDNGDQCPVSTRSPVTHVMAVPHATAMASDIEGFAVTRAMKKTTKCKQKTVAPFPMNLAQVKGKCLAKC